MRYAFRKKYLVLIVSIFDALGYIVSGPARLFSGKASKARPEKIMVIRIDHIGDVVLAECVLKPLRDKFPHAVIDILLPVCAAEIIENNPYVDKIIEFDAPWFRRENRGFFEHVNAFFRLKDIIRKNRYDTVIDLRGDLRHIAAMFCAKAKTRISCGVTGGGFLLTHNAPYVRSQHEAKKNLAMLAPLGIDARYHNPEIFFDKKDLAKADLLMKQTGIECSYAVIHAVPGHYSKEWSRTNFYEVIKYVRDIKKILPVFIGTESDKAFIQEIIGLLGGGVVDLSGKTDLKTIAKLIEGADLFFGLDSGPAHIAAATDTPSIVLFSGVNDEDQWAPIGKNIKVICPGRNKNLSEVKAERVCGALDEIIGKRHIRGNKI